MGRLGRRSSSLAMNEPWQRSVLRTGASIGFTCSPWNLAFLPSRRLWKALSIFGQRYGARRSCDLAPCSASRAEREGQRYRVEQEEGEARKIRGPQHFATIAFRLLEMTGLSR